ncbi:hypothetical protein ONE63_011264 [Megalurothrips usitatus]|uniref:HAT C-terminal dimerisation domain-containing protein n=1 Tax=Megalurothrips usitatus TaxID=439358 RepID=A0AAV7X2L2_9NEOP|nr:hypothetical protein ONE63_011264 [Megalurothrips usitatus]
MEERFLAHRNLLSCFKILLPSRAACEAGFGPEDIAQVKILYATYQRVLDCCELEVLGEFKLYFRHLSLQPQNVEIPRSALDALKLCPRQVFPSVNYLLRILALLPVTTSTAERSFNQVLQYMSENRVLKAVNISL